MHSLELLRRRLHGLFGRSFRLEVSSHVGHGTTVTLSIPLRMQFEVSGRSFESDAADPRSPGVRLAGAVSASRRMAWGVWACGRVGVTRRRRALLPDGTYETHGTNVTDPLVP